MLTGTWKTPSGHDEYALTFDRGREKRVLIIPALFDESNKLRRFTVAAMRALDTAGIDSFLPDLPGTNESRESLSRQTLCEWHRAMEAAAAHFSVTQALTIRGGCLVKALDLPRAHYAPVAGASLLRGLLRGHVLQRREAGHNCKVESELEIAREHGLRMVGYGCSAQLIRDLETAKPAANPARTIAQSELAGPALWLRAEPDENVSQSRKLAQLIAEWVG